ncbi:uncharacterized protein LOC135131262 [Zophobas morio]|uniref:uncharacterized protein LOC135131262 n=1 Tax=Zophobas morio TaxID=2755281 RepID=UPI003082CEA1
MAHKSQWPEKVPVLPDWCDFHSASPTKRIIFIGIMRTTIALISFGLCVAFLAVYDSSSGVQILLGIIIALNLLHVFVTIYFIYVGRPGNPRIIKGWFITDMVITGLYILLIIILLCTIPAERLHIFLGIKLIVLSLLLCFRYTRNYIYFLEKPIPVYI